MLSTPPDFESNVAPESPTSPAVNATVNSGANPAAKPIAAGPVAPSSTTIPPNKPPDASPNIDAAGAVPDAESLADEAAKSAVDDEDDLPQFRLIDPALIYLILLGVTVLGLNALVPDVRYTVLWTILIIVGLLALLFDALEVEIPTAQDMGWGIGYGLIVGVPLLVIALPQLQRTSLTLFDRSSETLAFQALVMVMPAAESLFFRGAMQPTRGLLFTAIAASIWSMILLFPQLHVMELPLVAAVIGFMFIVLNLLYSYVKRRFGLFASWTCQVTINVLLLFVVRYIQLS